MSLSRGKRHATERLVWAKEVGISTEAWLKPQPLNSRIELLRRAGMRDDKIRAYTVSWFEAVSN